MALVRGKQVETLKHKAKPFASKAGEIGFGKLCNVDAIEPIMAAGRPIEAAKDRHQRRLARSGRAHDGNEFAVLDDQA